MKNVKMLHDTFQPVENEPDAALENGHVDGVHVVVRLVVVHRDAGSEHDGRYAALQKDALVAYLAVEDDGEIIASEIIVT